MPGINGYCTKAYVLGKWKKMSKASVSNSDAGIATSLHIFFLLLGSTFFFFLILFKILNRKLTVFLKVEVFANSVKSFISADTLNYIQIYANFELKFWGFIFRFPNSISTV